MIAPLRMSVRDGFRRVWARRSFGWRPLLWFWVAFLASAGAGGGVLQWLGPPPGHSSPPDVAAPSAPPPAKPSEAAQAAPIPAAKPVAAPSAAPAEAGTPPKPRPSLPPPPDAGASAEPAKPRPPALVILYAANSDSSRAAAEQLVTRSGVTPDQVEAKATDDVPALSLIRFYATEDHAWARRLGQELSGLGYTWRIENLSGRTPKAEHPSVEVWLPDRRKAS